MKVKFKVLILTLSLAVCVVSLQKAEAHCPWNDPVHCASHLDPTKDLPGGNIAAEEAWGSVGRGLYEEGNARMQRNNIGPRTILSNRRKERLRIQFGSLVDRVRIIYNANMLDRLGSGQFQIRAGSEGQTFCNQIYIKEPYSENDYGQLILLAHELEHSRQCERLGGMSNFGYHYFKEYKKAGLNYNNNLLERQARDAESRFASSTALVCNERQEQLLLAIALRIGGNDKVTNGWWNLSSGQCRSFSYPNASVIYAMAMRPNGGTFYPNYNEKNLDNTATFCIHKKNRMESLGVGTCHSAQGDKPYDFSASGNYKFTNFGRVSGLIDFTFR